MLEQVKELTVLVRSLGRSSGKGALKRAPQQVSLAFPSNALSFAFSPHIDPATNQNCSLLQLAKSDI